MPNTDVAFGGVLGDDRSQIVDATGLFAEFKPAVMNGTQARGVVPTVFKPAEAFEDDVLGGLLPNVGDDATHGAILV
jgi:hypothetical protein